MNECDTGAHRCHAHAICTNTAGSHTCECQPGYEGDGRSCKGKTSRRSQKLGNH